MKKAALFAVVAVLLAISLPAFAQEFPDVPPDHWAYDAVQELVNVGVIQGYPDGTYGGKRAMSRYEFAEAVAKLVPYIEEKVSAMVAGGPGGVGPAGPPGPAGAPGVGAEQLAAIQKLVDEFRDELAALGVDVEALRRDVAALNERVTALEEEVARVRFTGEANLIGRGEVRNSNFPAVDKDLRVLSVGAIPADRDNPLRNSKFLTDLEFALKGRVSEDASVNALIATGNYFQDLAFANNFGVPSAEVDDFTLWNLYLDGAMKLGPLGTAQVIVGRYPFQLTPLTMKFVDPDSYTYIPKLDNGDFVLDGGRASFNFGRVSLTAFAGKAQPIADLISPDLMMPGSVTGIEVAQVAGARAVIGAGSIGNVGLTYYQAGAPPIFGRSTITGADINTSFGNVGLAGEWAQSEPNDALLLAFPLSDEDNTAWNAKLNFNVGSLAIGAGYSVVETNYAAPGYWSRLATLVNPTNVKGAMGSLSYALGSRITLVAEGQFLQPDNDAAGQVVSARTSINQGRILNMAANQLDKITYWKAGLKYALTSTNSVDLGWEQVTLAPTSIGPPNDTEERLISVGLGHTINPNASLKLLYQIVSVEFGDATTATDMRGGVATAQFQLKY
ncbi:MAG TPA: S-layer homology domain-containing protein [Armatimonadota bacterium]|nr:S-layer homology domain-containing protein [Armatimonadota bacterium]